jgi:hypothetical protein
MATATAVVAAGKPRKRLAEIDGGLRSANERHVHGKRSYRQSACSDNSAERRRHLLSKFRHEILPSWVRATPDTALENTSSKQQARFISI